MKKKKNTFYHNMKRTVFYFSLHISIFFNYYERKEGSREFKLVQNIESYVFTKLLIRILHYTSIRIW